MTYKNSPMYTLLLIKRPYSGCANQPPIIICINLKLGHANRNNWIPMKKCVIYQIHVSLEVECCNRIVTCTPVKSVHHSIPGYAMNLAWISCHQEATATHQHYSLTYIFTSNIKDVFHFFSSLLLLIFIKYLVL